MSIDQAIEILCRCHTRDTDDDFEVIMGGGPGWGSALDTEYVNAWRTMRALRDAGRPSS